MSVNLEQWISDHNIDEVECIVPDINGVQRGKVLPAKKFLSSVKDKSLRIPGSVFICTIDGHYPEDIDDIWDKDPDKILIADPDTICVAPGFSSPTAFVIADAFNRDGTEVDIAPRTILKKVLGLYADKGWKPIIAPEVEFYLVSPNTDPDFPLTPPTGQSGRSESASQPYGLEAMNEYEDIIDHIYDDCELMGLDIDTMIHEMGAAQLEVNFIHGDPLRLADEVFLFKRAVRNVAKQHDVYATFMANPMAGQPGSAMHVHQSVVDAETGRNLFATANGRDSAAFRSYIAGLIRFMPQISPMWAPNVNSFRRMRPDSSAPINVQWGEDNRSCGFRVPIADKHNRRVENRLPGADSNPYLAIAASLVCGYIGMVDRMVPPKPITGSAYNRARTLPRTLEAALDRFASCKKVRNLLGDDFFEIFFAVKDYELFNYQSVVSSWERERDQGADALMTDPLNHSYYAATAQEWRPRPFEGDFACDVAVIGGGFTGLSAALACAERGFSVILFEAEHIGFGASGRNGGQLIPGLRWTASELEEEFGRERADALFDLCWRDNRVKARIAKHGIDCDLKAGHLEAAWTPKDFDAMRREADYLANRFDYRTEVVANGDMGRHIASPLYHGGIHDPQAGHFHPLNYAVGLAQAAEAAGVRIVEGRRASLDTTKARYVIDATDSWIGDVEPDLGRYTVPIMNYNIATAPLANADTLLPSDAAVADSRFVLNYFRLSADKRLIFGGGERYSQRPPRDIAAFVRPFMAEVFPQIADARIDYGWGGAVAVTMNRLPHIGRRGNVFFAHGFSGHGALVTTLAGELIAEAMAGTAERFDVLANLPSKPFPGGQWLRRPLATLGLLWYALRDRLG